MTFNADERRQINRARREAHPDWPSHREVMYPPHSPPVLLGETLPIRKIEHCRAYCKYCYWTHGNWWMMDQDDYQVGGEAPIILCGRCEYTSRADFAGLGLRHWKGDGS